MRFLLIDTGNSRVKWRIVDPRLDWPQDEGYAGAHGSWTLLVLFDERSRTMNWKRFEQGIAPLKQAAKKPEPPPKRD